jgi:hypothetical protein
MDVFALTMRLKAEGAALVKASLAEMRAGLKTTEKNAQQLDKAMGDVGGAAAKLGGILAGGAILGKFITETSEAQYAQAGLAAVLKSTQGVSGQTIESLNKHAAELQRLTTYGDDAVTSAQTMLLTFKKLGGEVFPRATEAVLDMATLMGGDLKGASIQLGKALDNPIAGISALTRVGVTFSDSQKATIETLVRSNRTMEAQKIILVEVESQMNKQAMAARNTLGGAIKALGNNFGELFENTADTTKGLTAFINAITNSLTKVGPQQEAFANGLKTIFGLLPQIAGLVAGVTAAFVAYYGAVAGVILAQSILTASSTILALLSLAKAVRSVADASALLSLVGGGLVKTAIALAAIGAGYAAYSVVTKKMAEATAAATAEMDALAASLGTGGTNPIAPGLELITEAGKGTVELLIELAAVAPITTDQMRLLVAEETRLGNALAQPNIALQQQVTLTQDLAKMRETLAKATVNMTEAEINSQLRMGGSARPTSSPLQVKPLPQITAINPAHEAQARASMVAMGESIEKQAAETLQKIRDSVAGQVAITFANAIASGMEAAVANKSIGAGFKAFGAVLLAGIGDILIRFGTQALLMSKLMAAFYDALPKNPIAAAGIAVAMIALGGALKGAATLAGNSGANRSAPVSSFAVGSGGGSTSTLPTLTYGPTSAAGAAGLSPMGATSITIIGPNDPVAQRAMQELITKANRRGNV